MISQEKLKILTPLQKLPRNVEDLGKRIVAQSPINHPIWSHCRRRTKMEARLFFKIIYHNRRGLPGQRKPLSKQKKPKKRRFYPSTMMR